MVNKELYLTWLSRTFLVWGALALSGCVGVDVKRLVFAPNQKWYVTEWLLDEREIESVNFSSDDGENLYALYLPNPNTELLTVYLHGNGGNVHNRIIALEQIKSLGTSVLALSYRGYLFSSGKPTEEGVYEDAKATLEFAMEELDYPVDKIVVMGRSLGSAVALDVAQNKDLAGLILVSPFSNSVDLYNTLNPLQKLIVSDRDNYIERSFRNIEKAANISAKTLVVHGTKDRIIPDHLGKAVFDAIKSDKEFVLLEGADHNNYGYAYTSEWDEAYWQSIRNLLTDNE